MVLQCGSGMASMQYRYSRGQTGQGSLPRPAWGSGSHGARATSPEPGGSAGTPLGNGGEPTKDRLGATPQDEVILQLENELHELRNACAWKDQRIAELSRTDVPAARLKRDIRLLASELHQTRKQWSESLSELQELQAQFGRSEAGGTGRDGNTVLLGRDVVDSPSAGANSDPIVSGSGVGRGGSSSNDRGSERTLRESIAQLQEENRQLKETVARLQVTPARDQNFESVQHTRQPSGASTQRSSEPPQPHAAAASLGGLPGQPCLAAGGYRAPDPSAAARAPYLGGQGPGQPGAGGSGPAPSAQTAVAPQEEQVFQIVYSTVHTENTATIGPTTLQGVGTVDGVAAVARVLLQRVHSSVCAAHRRPMGAAAAIPAPPGQPMQPGQLPMVMVGMPQGM